MKKAMSLMLALAMVLALAACGGSTGGTSGGTQPAAPSTGTQTSTGTQSSSGGSEGSASGAFKFGGSGPLTGDAAIYGKAAMNGAQIAVDEINAKGGIQIEFNPQDDEADGEKAVNAYNNLMDWGMQVMVGPVTTGSAIAASAVAYNDRTFCLTPSASSTDVTANKDNMYQLCFTDPNQGTGSADYIAENMPGHKIAVIYRNDDAYSQGIRDTFVKEAAAKGLTVVYEGTFTKDTQTDFSVQLGKAQSEGADLLFLPIYYQPASVILAQAKSMNYAPIFFGVDGMDGILTMEGFDTSLAEGVMLLTPFAADAGDDLTKNFVAEYQKRFNETPNQFAADGYDVVYVLYNALTESGCTPDMSAKDICEKLIAQIQKTSYNGLTGQDMTWSANGEVSKMPTAVVIQNGVYVSA
ncbi:MAG: amino acid ABC transporter substrate-binding protein [Ruminococcaceae bacterium]|nr:amino acid ABC transporter substrate-binding protein [Oscillospiraceae bacterium]